MRSLKSVGFVVLTTLGFISTVLAPKARADEWDKKTKVTFNEAVQVPGVALPAGTYVFKLADSDGDRTIVQIFNEDETKLITTILAIPDYHLQTPDKTIISFDERPTGQPEALKAWFYPGDNYGVAFVYPKQRATELAQANRQPVLSVREDLSDAGSMKSATVEAVAPPPAPPAYPEAMVSVTQTEVAVVEELPRTASPISLLALSGVLLLGGAITVRRLSPSHR